MRARRSFATGLAGGIVVLVALRLWHGSDYWNYSEGVYALTSRLWRQGADLYGTMAAAQPPGTFVVGAALNAIHDSLGFLRTGVGVIQLAGGMLAAGITWRLSENALATAATPALVLLTPWAVHENGVLTPESLGAPLLLGGALLVARPRTAAVGGAVAALAVGFKLPFLLPVLGLLACASDRRRATLAALVTGAAMAALALLAFGSDVLRDVVTAQLHSDTRPLHTVPGVFVQAGWNLAGLVLLGAALLRFAEARDRAQLRAWTGLAIGLLLTALTTYKLGTALNVLAPVEAALVPGALAALALLTRLRIAAFAALAFTLIQTVSLLAQPESTAFPFTYPTSARGAWGRDSSAAQVRATVAAARACPPGVSYSGAPFYAFVAHRPPPGGQPDGYLPLHSTTLTREYRAMDADRTRCP